MTQRSTAARVKVLYVMGAGRSGSTILGVCLGNCDGFFYAGELEEWLLRADGPRWASGERQRFWDAVKERVHGAEGLFGGAANRCIERSSALFRVDLWPARWRLRKVYRRVAGELIEAVSQVAGASYVVDTSHFPLRARELRKLDGVELYLVYLVRDPQAVVASNTRELSPHEVAETRWRMLTMNANLWVTQLVSALTFLRHPSERRLFVRHEDFLAEPERVLGQILAMAGATVEVPELSSLRVGAPLQANRLIRSETVSVRRGATPEPVPRSLLTWLLQAPWRPVLKRLRPAASLTRP
jgi:Sulfotransferase family